MVHLDSSKMFDKVPPDIGGDAMEKCGLDDNVAQ